MTAYMISSRVSTSPIVDQRTTEKEAWWIDDIIAQYRDIP